MKMGIIEKQVWFWLNETELAQYCVTIEQLRDRKPFKEDIVLALADKAHKEYGKEYVFEGSKMRIQTLGDHVLITMTEKSKIIHLENDYAEEESIIDGIQELLKELPDEKINMGIMEVEEKRKQLELLRSEAGRKIIRQEMLYREE